MGGKRWDVAEKQVIEDYLLTEGMSGIHKRLPHRTISAINHQAFRLGIRLDNCLKWTFSDNLVIENYWYSEGPKGCHKRLPYRTISAIKSQAFKLEVKGNKSRNFIDLTGNIYGIYEVTKRGPDYTNPKGRLIVRWEIKCTKCGAIRFVYASNLKKWGYITCSKCPKLEIGKIYNKYVEPIEQIKDYVNCKNGRHRQQFLMKCHYGAEGCKGTFPALAKNVLNGTAKSCGCLKKEKARERCGEKNPNWQGGVTEFRNLIRKCDKGLRWAKDCRKRDNYTCQKCGKRGGELPVHHALVYFVTLLEELIEQGITNVRDIPDDSEFWNIENGSTLCTDCHKEAHREFKDGSTKEDFEEWVKGEIVEP